ncbi:hypothetical protein Taro_036886 [Colocasia esculenta]|uniref:Uncharacterized protein n=1 Tax=Colocasia esculenta TaxID=4460 RepID=A0A843WN05_COLES|nr:hypothetical protein [Colocasia esculenta]
MPKLREHQLHFSPRPTNSKRSIAPPSAACLRRFFEGGSVGEMALVQIEETPRWKKLLSYVGPGFFVAVAYLDPGNLQTDLQAGADHKFEYYDTLSHLDAGKHLSEHCKREYPRHLNYCLWILAEVAVIAADIPQVLGAAFALHILFNVPIWGGVLLSGISTLLLLGLQKFGIRKLEMVIAILIFVVGGCFFVELARSKPDMGEIAKGMFVPRLAGNGAARDTVALLGALVMPHNLFLHSALVLSRKIPHTYHGISSACRNFLIEGAFALFVAFLVNVSVVSVTGTVCYSPHLTTLNMTSCRNITLESAATLLKTALGTWSSKIYAVSLLASGQSSTVTGTYAGQYIMQGFLDLKMKTWSRNLLTRSVAITPSLVACIIGGSSGAGKLIIVASMILAFQLPFALIPLLRFTGSETKMGYHKNSMPVSSLFSSPKSY